MQMSSMNPLTAQWMNDLHNHLSSQPGIINDFRATGFNCH